MGPLGIPGRILAPVLGVPFVFAPLNEGETSAPGQIPVKELIKTYHFNKLNRETAVYGLLGFPVAQSPSHVTHNAIFEHFEINAVYVKLLTPPESLEKVLSLIKQLPFKGVNLTIPLKEAVIPFLDENHSTCNSVNTLDIRDRVKGYSTDGAGALNPIEEHIKVKGKKIVVLGAGGAAKAIVEEAKKRGALVVVMNRSYNEDLETQPLDPTVLYDILINTTPIEIPLAFLKKGKFVLDIKHDTKCSIQAESEGCKVIPGYKMFVEQAAAQFKIWLNIDCKDILDRLVFNYSNK
jgi:3-dehydroquinate dehydratase/shikimate dehydrogenase